MTAEKESQLILSLNEGVTERVAEDVAGGVITVSENTRLTRTLGTTAKRPSVTAIWEAPSDTTVCGGLVPGGRDSVAAYFKPAVGHRRITDVLIEEPIAAVTGTAQQNAYFPYPMIDSGALGGGYTALTPATTFDDDGRQWFAAVRGGDGATAVYVNVIHEGRDVITARAVAPITTSLGELAVFNVWCGITTCTDGVTLWYAHEAGIYARKLEIDVDGITLTIGAESSIIAPIAISNHHTADVVSDGADAAWLLTRDPSTNTSTVITRVDTATLTASGSLELTSTMSASAPMRGAIQRYTDGVTEYVFWAVVYQTSATVRFGAVNAATMAAIWATSVAYSGSTAIDRASLALQPRVVTGSTAAIVLAVTEFTTTSAAVTFYSRVMTDGTAIGSVKANHYALQSRGAHHIVSASEVYPYFPVLASWSSLTSFAVPAAPGAVPSAFVDDPSVEVVTLYSATVLTPVARFGVDRISTSDKPFQSNAAAISPDGRLSFVYSERRADQTRQSDNAWGTRYVTLELEPTSQPRYAVDHGNVAVIAAGLVAAWDGSETTEYGPFHRPRISVTTTGGTGPDLTGDYFFTAVVSWRDAAGNVRRSPPALPYPVTLAGTKPIVNVTTPLTMRSGDRQEDFDVTLYATIAGGALFFAQSSIPTSKPLNSPNWQFASIQEPAARDVLLYSTGAGNQPLLPECPPPAYDICSIGGRLWVIDAENRYRLLPSLLKQVGIAYEFNATLEITGFDQQYGKLVAVVDVGGQPYALAERGLWRIDGYGPDNNGQGQGFNDPQLASNQGCRSRESVVQLPGAGVLFQATDGRFMLLGEGVTKRFETFGVYDVGTPTVHLAEREVIYPIQDGSGFVVYNWLADAWTHWPTLTP